MVLTLEYLLHQQIIKITLYLYHIKYNIYTIIYNMDSTNIYELIGDNLTYINDNFINCNIIRSFLTGDSNDKLPNAVDFIKLFKKTASKETYEFSITNNSSGVLIINPGDNIIFKDNIYVISSNEKKEFMACIFSVEPCIIGIVTK